MTARGEPWRHLQQGGRKAGGKGKGQPPASVLVVCGIASKTLRIKIQPLGLEGSACAGLPYPTLVKAQDPFSLLGLFGVGPFWG